MKLTHCTAININELGNTLKRTPLPLHSLSLRDKEGGLQVNMGCTFWSFLLKKPPLLKLIFESHSWLVKKILTPWDCRSGWSSSQSASFWQVENDTQKSTFLQNGAFTRRTGSHLKFACCFQNTPNVTGWTIGRHPANLHDEWCNRSKYFTQCMRRKASKNSWNKQHTEYTIYTW